MKHLVVDDATREKMLHVTKVIGVYDEAGNLLGHFTPHAGASLCEGLELDITEEELDRRERAGGGRTLAEILADLEKRA